MKSRGWKLIARDTVSGTTTTSIIRTNPEAFPNYSQLWIRLYARSDVSAYYDNLYFYVYTGDPATKVTSGYHSAAIYSTSTTRSWSTTTGAAQCGGWMPITGASATANFFGNVDIRIPKANDATYRHVWESTGYAANNSTSSGYTAYAKQYAAHTGTGSITGIEVKCGASNNFVAGSKLDIYGYTADS